MKNVYTMTLQSILSSSPVVYILSFFMSLLVQEKALFLTMIVFVFVDLITGIWKAFKIKDKITSKALRRTIEKLLTYFLVILLAKLFDEHVLQIKVVELHTIVAGIIFLVEFKSVTENMAEITGNKVFTKIYDVVEKLFDKTKKV